MCFLQGSASTCHGKHLVDVGHDPTFLVRIIERNRGHVGSLEPKESLSRSRLVRRASPRVYSGTLAQDSAVAAADSCEMIVALWALSWAG